MTEPHDIPTAAGLVEAVRGFLERDVLDATVGRVKLNTRVAINVLGMVQRELEVGTAQAVAHDEGLRRLGFGSDADLAAAIRSGAADDRVDEVTEFLRQTVRAKLEVANPKYLAGPTA